MEQNSFVKGSLTTIILKLLEDNGRMYGYEMTRAVKEMTGGRMEIGEAALYPALHKLVADGLLETSSEIVDNRLRKYYSLSRQGKKETVSRVNALKESIAQLQLILNSSIAHG